MSNPLKMLSLVAILIAAICHIESGIIVGYVPNWPTLDLSYVDPESVTHLLYAFVGIKQDGSVDYKKDHFQMLMEFKNKNLGIKILPSIGGATYTWMFNSLASLGQLQKFVSSCAQLVSQYNLDGIDIDWEYPQGTAQRTIYANILKELRKALPDKLLMSAVPAGNQNFGGFDTAAMNKYLDYAAIMSYDYHAASWDSRTGHNSPLYGSGAFTTKGSIDEWEKVGLNRNIMVVGLAFYGRTWRLSTSNSGVGAPTSGVGSGTEGILTYDQIRGNKWQEKWDDIAQVPYGLRGSEWLSYDNEKSLTNKVKWSCDNKMAGVMVWELSQDKSKTLIHAISDTMKQCGGGNPIKPSKGTTPHPYWDTTTPDTAPPDYGDNGCLSDTNEICNRSGPVLAAYPPDCGKYVNCNPEANQAIMPCPATLVFNPSVQTCDYDYNYNCQSC
ncbi:unnamed protein product [Gordionus sp. m RMFG-2023]